LLDGQLPQLPPLLDLLTAVLCLGGASQPFTEQCGEPFRRGLRVPDPARGFGLGQLLINARRAHGTRQVSDPDTDPRSDHTRDQATIAPTTVGFGVLAPPALLGSRL
jgi:hypothetical protein